MTPRQDTGMLQPPALGMTTRETENRERDGETTGQPDGNQTALKEWYNSDLDRIVEYLASEISREDPNHYNAPTIPFPPFRNACQIPPETHFFPPRHAADGLSSEILHYLMNQDRTPEGLLRLLLVHQVPIERLQVPFSDENITPEDLCTSFHCPITVEHRERRYVHNGERIPWAQREALRSIGLEDIWGESNPPPFIWRAFSKLVTGKNDEDDNDNDVVFHFLRTHVPPYIPIEGPHPFEES